MIEVLPLQTHLQKQGSGPLQNLEGEDKGKKLVFPMLQGKKGAARIINPLGSEECAALKWCEDQGFSNLMPA